MEKAVDAGYERELKTLRLLVEQTSEGILAFVLYSNLRTRTQVFDWLQANTSVPVIAFTLSNEINDPGAIATAFIHPPRCCLVFLDVEAAFPMFLGYVNLNREKLTSSGHALVFCIREEGLRRIAEEAPDFWAWRSRVFDFRTSDVPALGSTGPHDNVIGSYTVPEIEEQLSFLAGSAPDDLVSQLALGRRQLALKRYSEADQALQQAADHAANARDGRGSAEALLLLGNSAFDQGQSEKAEAQYKQSLAIAEKIGANNLRISATRQLSLVQQQRGDYEAAYATASHLVQIAERLKDPSALASAYDQLGNILFARNDLRAAERAYLQAIEYEERLQHTSDLAFTLVRLGQVYEQMGALPKVHETLSRASKLSQTYGSSEIEAQIQAILQRVTPR